MTQHGSAPVLFNEGDDQGMNEPAPNQMAPHTLSPMERQALAKLNVPARMLVGEVGSYASAKAERQAWDEYHWPSKDAPLFYLTKEKR